MMNSRAWLVLVAALVPASTLLVVGYSHLAAPARFRTELAAQQIPLMRSQWFGMLIAAVEVLAGCIVIAGVLVSGALATTGLAASCILLCAFATFTARQQWIRPGLPCACGGASMETNGWTIVRALVLATLAALSALGPLGTEGFTTSELLLAFVATGSVATLLWSLPASMALPGEIAREGVEA